MTDFVSATSFHYLLHPHTTLLVTCCDDAGRANIIAIAWLTPVSINPPLLALMIRPDRYSYPLIRATREFVVNVASREIAAQTLFCGRRSGRDVDKFAATGLTAQPARLVRPPIIAECLAHLECRVAQDIEAGDHHIVIGAVVAAYARAGVLDAEGLYDPRRAQPLLHLGRNRFTTTRADSIEPALPRG